MPVVAGRVATATAPDPSSSLFAATSSRRWARLPTARTDSMESPRISEIPAESYPRYSRRVSPARSRSCAGRLPTYPTMPHMRALLSVRTTAEPRSAAPEDAHGSTVAAIYHTAAMQRFRAVRARGGVRSAGRGDPLDDRDEALAHCVRLLGGRRLDHDAHERLGATRAYEDASTAGEGIALPGARGDDVRMGHRGVAVGDAHVDQALRELAHRVAAHEVGAVEGLERQQRARDAVAGGREAELDDVARLLAAEHPAAVAQLLEHVAVADLRRRDLDAGLLHRRVEAVVRHHRHGDPIARETAGAAQVQRGEGDELVAVDDGAGAVDGEDAVAVAVEGEPDVVAALADGLDERAEVRGAHAGVDVAPVGLDGHRRHRRAEAAEGLGRDVRGRAVGAVQDDV